MSGIRIELPWPDADLWPNRRSHFMVKARAAKQAKHDGMYATRTALFDGPRITTSDSTAIHMRLVFCPPTNRRRDLDNAQAAAKHYLDGIALALGVNDALFRPVSVWGDIVPKGRLWVELL